MEIYIMLLEKRIVESGELPVSVAYLQDTLLVNILVNEVVPTEGAGEDDSQSPEGGSKFEFTQLVLAKETQVGDVKVIVQSEYESVVQELEMSNLNIIRKGLLGRKLSTQDTKDLEDVGIKCDALQAELEGVELEIEAQVSELPKEG